MNRPVNRPVNRAGTIRRTAGRAFVWQRGVMTDLGTLGGDHAYAHDINERGQIVGISGTAEPAHHGFLWDRGVMTDLGTGPGEDHSSDARVINDKGEVAGGSNSNRVVLWRHGRRIDLGPAGDFAPARGINNQGQVIAVDNVGPYVWQRGTRTQLTVPGASQFFWLVDINERGQILLGGVVDDTVPEAPKERVFLWDRGTFTDVGTLGGDRTTAVAVNDRGRRVASPRGTGFTGTSPRASR